MIICDGVIVNDVTVMSVFVGSDWATIILENRDRIELALNKISYISDRHNNERICSHTLSLEVFRDTLERLRKSVTRQQEMVEIQTDESRLTSSGSNHQEGYM